MAELPRCDFHIHTKYLRCANETMEIATIVAECRRIGVKQIAMTDHLSSLDQIEQHCPILADLRNIETNIDLFFGIELSLLGPEGGYPFNSEVKEKYEFQFAIGAIHGTYLDEYDPKKLIDIQHRNHIRSCEDPLIDVVAHPYRFKRKHFERRGWPWFGSIAAVPESYARELGQAGRQTGTAIEINVGAIFKNNPDSPQYVDEYINYLSIIAEEGANFSFGSDAHGLGGLKLIEDAWWIADKLNLTHGRIYVPSANPINRG